MENMDINLPDLSSLRAMVPLAVPAIKATVETWLVPAASKLLKKYEVD